ncbi:MAG TPA: carbohydrate porin [Vicinamibacterales bacterium]|nr:carbohydrate porin [Vicinamibacterales bacterium]
MKIIVCTCLLLVTNGRPLGAQVTTGPVTPPEAAQTSPPGTPDELGFRFHGYLRSGLGVDGTGKGQQPFIAPLAPAKYRLGNEAETYLETTFAYGTNSEDPDPAYFDTRITLAYVAPTSQSNTFATTFSLREAYALARRVWEAQPTATFWAGARFYDRHDLHMLDFWYRDPSGFGGGVEDIMLGDEARLAFSWIGGSQDQLESNGSVPRDDRLNKNTFEARVYGFDVSGARLSLAFDLAHFNGDEVATDTGTVLVEDGVGAAGQVIVEWPFTGGRYKTALQYGTGPAYDFRSVLGPPVGRTFAAGEVFDTGDLWQFRFVNDFVVEQRGPWQLQGAVIYQELDNGAAANNRVRWVSVGARPVYALGRFFSLAVEGGWDHTKQSDLPGGSLFKLTVAPQITPNLKFFSRPSLRTFATWAHWSESFRGLVAPVTYGDDLNGFSFGVQLETWW